MKDYGSYIEAIPQEGAPGLLLIRGAFHNPLQYFERSPWYEDRSTGRLEEARAVSEERARSEAEN